MLPLVFLLLVSSLSGTHGNYRTCMCSYKIGSATGDTINTVHRIGAITTCREVEPRCPNDCRNNAEKFFKFSTTAGRNKVCSIYGGSSITGVVVYSGSIASSCQGYARYQTTIGEGIICCKRPCSACRRYYKVGYSAYLQYLDSWKPNVPNNDLYYACLSRGELENVCFADCKKAMSSLTPQNFCNTVKRQIGYPGATFGVSFSAPYYTKRELSSPAVCCGCICDLEAVINGQSSSMPVHLHQSKETTTFDCAKQSGQCKDHCRSVIASALNNKKATFSSFDQASGDKVCGLLGEHNSVNSPGHVVYSTYSYGTGLKKDYLGTVCCGCTCDLKASLASGKLVEVQLPLTQYLKTKFYTCQNQKQDCSNDCRSAIGAVFNKDRTMFGKFDANSGRKMCDLVWKKNFTATDIPVYSQYKFGQITEMDPLGTVCCGKCLSCAVRYTQITNNFVAKEYKLDGPLDPSPYYDCSQRLTAKCEKDCSAALTVASNKKYFGRNSVDSVSAQKVCANIGRPISTPGLRLEVTYDIGDNHHHHFVVPGGSVCCGCNCNLKAKTVSGDIVKVPITLAQSAKYKYYNCQAQEEECRKDCRSVIGNALTANKGPFTEFDKYSGEKVCRKVDQNSFFNETGIPLYSEYQFGAIDGLDYLGSVCCRKCQACVLRYIENDNGQVKKEFVLDGPHNVTSYHCSRRLTTTCEKSCNATLLSPSNHEYFGNTFVNAVSAQRVCEKLGRAIPSPGLRVEVNYDMGDDHYHHFLVPGGNVCCGCSCEVKIRYEINGTVNTLGVAAELAARPKYFACGSHDIQCKNQCRTTAGKALTGEEKPVTKLDPNIAKKVCMLLNTTVPDPGALVYTEYDVGRGSRGDSLGYVCCFEIPEEYRAIGLPPILATLC